MNLELAAMRWLWIDRRCWMVIEQRSPRYGMGNPDVLGLTLGRHLVEIEIKRSVADFNADRWKRHRESGVKEPERRARQLYYLVPDAICKSVEHTCPDYAGLMSVGNSFYSLTVKKTAPVNREAKKLDARECVKLARLMTSHMMGYAIAVDTWKSRFVHNGQLDHTDWVNSKAGTYTI
jgi:hypothetical protein